jgi:hypothetical protein
MADLFDYLSWRGDLDFTRLAFNPVDYIIFSQISYLPFDGIVPGPDEKEGIGVHLALRKLEEKINSKNTELKPELLFHEDPRFISSLASSARFRNCHLFGYINKVDTDMEYQFAAISIYTKGGCCIAFRGTDESFIGWKENFNMSFREIIPSQAEAVKYIEKMAPKIKGRLRVCGHSKGGNLAVYSAAFCRKKIQKRITDIYSYDAPGFNKKIIKGVNFTAVKDRIHSYIPQGSVVGMLLEHGNDYIVVKSSQTGLLQHILFSWEVTHNDIVHAGNVTQSSLFIGKTIQEWIESNDNGQREKFIEALYAVLTSSEINSVHEMENSWFISAGKIIKSFSSIDEETRKLIFNVLTELFRSAGRNIETLFNQKKLTTP